MPVYEYLVIYNIYSIQGSGIEQKWTARFEVWWPDAANSEELAGDGLALSTLLNELGRNGWKIVASDVIESAVVAGSRYGLPEIGMPVRQRWIFMREISK